MVPQIQYLDSCLFSIQNLTLTVDELSSLKARGFLGHLGRICPASPLWHYTVETKGLAAIEPVSVETGTLFIDFLLEDETWEDSW